MDEYQVIRERSKELTELILDNFKVLPRIRNKEKLNSWILRCREVDNEATDRHIAMTKMSYHLEKRANQLIDLGYNPVDLWEKEFENPYYEVIGYIKKQRGKKFQTGENNLTFVGNAV